MHCASLHNLRYNNYNKVLILANEDNSPQGDLSQLNFLDDSSEASIFPNDCEKKFGLNPKEGNYLKDGHKDQRPTPKMLLILDTETTGLEPQDNQCIEIGAILFNVTHRSILAQQSFLMPVENNDAEKINKIPAEVSQILQPWEEGIVYFKSLVNAADAIVAHNASFDRKWFGKSPLPEIIKPWICSMDDMIWPKDRQLKSRPSVRDLALAYGVPVWNAHRALTDCIYLAEVFIRCENLEELIQISLEPRRLMKAKVSYDQRNLAKKAGFRWNDHLQGAWTRRLREKEILELDFPVEEVEH